MIDACFSMSSTMPTSRLFSVCDAIRCFYNYRILSLKSLLLPPFGDPNRPSGINEKLSFAEPCEERGLLGVSCEDLRIYSIMAYKLAIYLSNSVRSASWSLLSCLITYFILLLGVWGPMLSSCDWLLSLLLFGEGFFVRFLIVSFFSSISSIYLYTCTSSLSMRPSASFLIFVSSFSFFDDLLLLIYECLFHSISSLQIDPIHRLLELFNW